MLGHLGQGVATAASTTCSHGSSTASLRGRVEVVLVGASRELGTLDFTCQATARKLLERGRLHIAPEDVLGGRLARNAAEHHAVEQGVAAETIVTVDATSDLASSVEARDELASAVDAT